MDYIVNTPCGQLQGIAGSVPGTIAYKGIRYATAGRWVYPKQVKSWEGVYDATQYGACSYQPRAFYNEEENLKKIFYYNEFRKGETYTYSEDCLFLNIFTPETAKEGDKLPVLIYIHGGGFTGGCGHEKHFDGPVWPTKGIIGVTLNYRLGPMGFVCLPQLKEEAGFTGNYGLYDQMTAIQWVKDNIAAFGGDPDNMTIMGQSAGAASVQLQCTSPMTDKDRQLSEQMVQYLCNFVRSGNPNSVGELPTWIASGKGQNRVLLLGEKPTGMGKPNLFKMIWTMFSNKAVGE